MFVALAAASALAAEDALCEWGLTTLEGGESAIGALRGTPSALDGWFVMRTPAPGYADCLVHGTSSFVCVRPGDEADQDALATRLTTCLVGRGFRGLPAIPHEDIDRWVRDQAGGTVMYAGSGYFPADGPYPAVVGVYFGTADPGSDTWPVHRASGRRVATNMCQLVDTASESAAYGFGPIRGGVDPENAGWNLTSSTPEGWRCAVNTYTAELKCTAPSALLAAVDKELLACLSLPWTAGVATDSRTRHRWDRAAIAGNFTASTRQDGTFATVTLKYVPPPDRDNDGVKDDADSCPDVPGTARYLGCAGPPPPKVIRLDGG